MAEKYYTSTGEEYYPGATYIFTDKDGNTFSSKGDNGYVWQSMTEGIPISVNDKGEWYTEPYLEQTPTGLTAHIPNWFKTTDEYTRWQTEFVPQISTMSITQDNIDTLKKTLKSLGSQGAVRNSLKADVSRFGVTDKDLQNKYVNDIVALVTEGKTGTKAQFNDIFGSNMNESAEDIARGYKNLSKEDLSSLVTSFNNMVSASQRDDWTGSKKEQKKVLDALTTLKILNYVDDNYSSFGKDNEFQGLLEASTWQKIQRAFATASATFTESNVLGIPVRAAYGIKSALSGNGFDMQIENSVNNQLSNRPDWGAGLEGGEGAEAIGMWGGALTNIAASVTLLNGVGNFVNAKMADTTAAQILNSMSNSGITGKIAYDFFLNDLPLDVTMFINDIARTNGDVGKALWDPNEKQPLTGIPFIRKDAETGFYLPSGLGPDVPGGLVMNIVGDLVADCAPMVIKVAGNATSKKLDSISNGGFTRLRENVALKGLQARETLTKIPVIGEGWQKFINHMMGAEKANIIRQATKAAIAEWSMEPYIRAQNLLTLGNHKGMTVIKPLYEKLESDLGSAKAAKEFIKNARTYGGIGETRVDWKEISNGKVQEGYKVLPDTLPREVKQGLLDVERLSELKGEIQNESGVIPSPARDKEIAEIEERLSKTPQEIKDFAQTFSDLNKGVERIAVELGIKSEEWVDAMNLDPRWAQYMTRQALVPGYASTMAKRDPSAQKILTQKRRGYYADNYIDPMLALSMKVEALGRAYAANEMKKALVSFELVQNKVIAGKGGVETAQKLADIKEKLRVGGEYRDSIKYDSIISGIGNDALSIEAAFTEINNLLHLPEAISLKSVYNASQSPKIITFLDEFEQGKIKFAEGVAEKAGISDSEAATIVKNVYAYNGNKVSSNSKQGGDAKATVNTPDNIAKEDLSQKDLNYSAGVNDRGVPYKFTVEDGKITSLEKITDAEGIAEAINHLGGTYRIDVDTVTRLGNENSFAINRAIIFLRDNMPNLPTPVTFELNPGSSAGVIGWITKPNTFDYKISVDEKGHIVCGLYRVNLANNWYSKGKEEFLLEGSKDMVRRRESPKNAIDASYTPIHESGHMLMARLSVLEANRKIDEGTIEAPKNEYEAASIMRNEFEQLHVQLAKNAAEKLGYKFSENQWQALADTISTYASSPGIFHYETFSEALSDFAFNNSSAQKFSLAIVDEMKKMSERYTNAASPLKVFKENGMEVPKGLFTDNGTYKFPSWKGQTVKRTEVVISRPLLGQTEVKPFNQKMYHGSGKTADQIYTSAQVPILGQGKYWAFSESNAKQFGSNVESSSVSLKNPLVITKDDDWRQLAKEAGWKYPNPIGMDEKTVKQYTDALKLMVTDAGYDGIVIRMAPGEDTSLLFDVFGMPQVVDYGVKLTEKTITETAPVNADAKRAEWLDTWRQKNPYLKENGKDIKEFTTEQYQKANLWDTYFQKEIRAFDPNSKSAMPDALAKKNGDFLAKLTDNAAKEMVVKLREHSVEGVTQELATMILSSNAADVSKAMNDFIVKRINRAADELAGNMPGGKTADNLNTARATLWGEVTVKEDYVRIISSLSPDLDYRTVAESIDTLFKEQAEGFASIDRLPVDLKELGREKRILEEKLAKENSYAIKKGKEVDKKLHEEYLGDATQVISYKQGGEDVFVVVSDPTVADLLKQPANYKESGMTVEALAEMANLVARTYRLGTTTLTPIALVRNVLRDPLQAIITDGFNPLNMNLSPEAFYRTLRQYGLDDVTIKDVTQRLRTWAGASGLTAEMRELGIENVSSMSYSNGVQKAAKKLKKIGDSKIMEVAEAPLEAWETMFRNQIGQQSFIKNYRRTGDVNKAMAAALFDTSNATTNFSHSVGIFKRATSTVPYLSSAINGTASFWRLFTVDPLGMVTRISAGFMVPIMAITAWNLSDEERRKRYMKLPEWYRQSHIVLMDMEGKNIFAFPIPEEIQQFSGTARKLIEFTSESSPYSLATILAQGAFGFLPGEMDGFFGEDGSIDFGRGIAQLGSGYLPQAVTAIYEFIAEKDLYTGQDLSSYNGLNKTINTLTNIFGAGFKQAVNSIGLLCGVSEKDLVGLSFGNTLARDLFGMGMDDAKNQFMNLVGNKESVDPVTGKIRPATGLFKENQELKKKIQAIDSDIAFADGERKAELEKQKAELIENFTNRVSTLMHKYMQLYSITGGLEEWKKEKIVQLLTLGDAWTSADDESYQAGDASQAYLNERALAQQRYVNAGLPAGPSLESLPKGSIELQAAVSRFYGTPKQATQDYKNAIEKSGVKNIRNEFYDAIQQIYDAADAQGKSPDYDLIERIQARYLQSIDAVLIPIINQYGVNILNNNDFIDAVRRQVNGMIPSDDWRQSTKNAKKFLSTKEFPTATVDVKKWLKQRYSSGMRDRGLDSDSEVTQMLESIKKDIDAGNRGTAKGKIESLRSGINKSNYYISAKDFQTLTDYYDMVK